jgi:hypothetical protein
MTQQRANRPLPHNHRGGPQSSPLVRPNRMSDTKRHCPDCRCEADPITLIVAGVPTQYMAGHMVPFLPSASGNIKGWVCPKCKRILLYAEPK